MKATLLIFFLVTGIRRGFSFNIVATWRNSYLCSQKLENRLTSDCSRFLRGAKVLSHLRLVHNGSCQRDLCTSKGELRP